MNQCVRPIMPDTRVPALNSSNLWSATNPEGALPDRIYDEDSRLRNLAVDSVGYSLSLRDDVPDASQHSDDANVYVATYYVFQVIDADKPTFTTKRRRYQVGEYRRRTKGRFQESLTRGIRSGSGPSMVVDKSHTYTTSATSWTENDRLGLTPVQAGQAWNHSGMKNPPSVKAPKWPAANEEA